MKTLDTLFNGVFLDYMTKILYENELNYMNFTYRICKETIMSSFIVAYFRRNHFLVGEINARIEALKSNGILGYWVKQYTSNKHSGIIAASYQPSQLNIEKLLGAFEILGYGLLVSLLCFTLEGFIAAMKKLLKRRKSKGKVHHLKKKVKQSK